MDSSLNFGPFRLIHPLGTGGMARVWYALHREQEQPVAIKVLTAERAREQRFVTAFRQEVRAVARLRHPNVIRIFDCGSVPADAEALTDGKVMAGSPFLAMEAADTTLASLDHNKLTWPHVRMVLMHILDALAHSHARGLIHRDLKPENILLFTSNSTARLKITDFGLAHAMNFTGSSPVADERVSGTPRYMAPEQIAAEFRMQGPWTDLYALGCLTYWLTTGEPPFTSDTVADVLRAHLSDPRPELEPEIETPRGFEHWLARLVDRRPGERFQRAADAACELARIDSTASPRAITLVAHTDEGRALDVTVVDDSEKTQILRDTLDVSQSVTDEMPAYQKNSMRLPELPRDWRHSEPQQESIEMVGVGLGLYGIRQLRLVGRHAERDRLWQTLTDMRHTRRPHGVILSGPAGIGKSRLANWLAERAHEVGAAEVLRASHSPVSGPADGLGRMFSDFLGCTGLSRAKILERLRNFYARHKDLDDEDLHQCMALTELIAPSSDPDFDESDIRVRFSKPREKFVVWEKLLRKIGAHRPVVLLFDDVHWGSKTLQFARYLCRPQRRGNLPIMTVMTCRIEALDQFPLARQLLEELRAQPLVDELHLPPLSDDEHDELIEDLLGLQPRAARQVADRTAGNPLFAIQLVGDWVERGILEISDDGFQIPAGEEAPLPANIHHLLTGRLEKLVGHGIDERSSDALLALELAAALGRRVDYREWRVVCDIAGVIVPSDLLDAMASRALARPTDHGWIFVHGALRETLERVASENRRLTDHHRCCVCMLQRVYDTDRDALAHRLARHLHAAGAYEEALDAFRRSMRHAWMFSDIESGQALFERFEATRATLGIADDDRRTVEGWLEWVVLLHRAFRLEEAGELLDQLEPVCKARQWPSLLARIYYLRSRVAGVLGSIREGLEFGRRSLTLYTKQGDQYGIARASYKLGWLHRWRGEFEEARQLVERAERLFADLDDEYHYNMSLSTLGIVCLGQQRYDEAIDYFQRALQGFRRHGDTNQIANCYNDLGEVYRYRGELDRAEDQYRQALRINNRFAVRSHLFYNLNLACVLLEQGKFEEAIPFLKTGLETAMNNDRLQFAGCAHAGMLAACAGTANWEGFDHHLRQAPRHLADSDLVDRDLALSFQWAGEQALQQGKGRRAKAAFDFAIDQWRQLDELDQIASIEELLAAYA